MRLSNAFVRGSFAALLVMGQVALVGTASAGSTTVPSTVTTGGNVTFNPSSMPGLTKTVLPNGVVVYTKGVSPSAIHGSYGTGSVTGTVGGGTTGAH